MDIALLPLITMADAIRLVAQILRSWGAKREVLVSEEVFETYKPLFQYQLSLQGFQIEFEALTQETDLDKYGAVIVAHPN